MDWLVRFIQIACWIEVISMHVNAQSAPSPKAFHGSDWQNWDELDLQTRLCSRLDATWVAQGRFSSRLPNPAAEALGADFNPEECWEFARDPRRSNCCQIREKLGRAFPPLQSIMRTDER